MTGVTKAMLKAGGAMAGSAALVPLMAGNALAHHMMGGRMPDTALHGFLSGIGHPVIGPDHFAFIVAVGVASAFLAQRFLMPAVFVLATLVGCVLVTAAGVHLPLREVVVASSVLVLGAAVMSGARFDARLLGALFAVAGLFHGAAYAQSIVGAEPTPLLAYLAGFTLIQYTIAAGVVLMVHSVLKAGSSLETKPRLAGALVAGIGVALLLENLETIAFPGL